MEDEYEYYCRTNAADWEIFIGSAVEYQMQHNILFVDQWIECERVEIFRKPSIWWFKNITTSRNKEIQEEEQPCEEFSKLNSIQVNVWMHQFLQSCKAKAGGPQAIKQNWNWKR